ncbi:MAG: PAS domain-containing protein [Burkholderiales bacterium]|nr:PAS domain-containing protein [Burkholderiales bacterium]
MGWQLGLDGLGLVGTDTQGAGALAARMSPATAAGTALIAAELLLCARPAAMARPQWLALAGLLIGWLGLSRHIYGGEPLVPFAAMAWPTALGLLILGVGTLLARSDGAFLALAQADTAGGTAVRRLLPVALLAPLALGWLRLQAQHAGWVGTESGLSLFALANVIVFGGLVWINARRLDRADREGRVAVAHKLTSQRLLQSIVDNSAAVIYAKDLDGRYLLANRLYLEIFHRSREDVLGRTDHDLFDRQAAEAFRAMDRRVAQAGQALIEEETAPQDDGLHTYLSVKCPLRDAEDRIVGTFGISTDISERRVAQERLEAQLERLRLLDQITRSIGEHQDLLSIYQVAIRSLEDSLPVDFSCICRYDATDHALTVVRAGAKSQPLAMALALQESASVAIDANGLARCVAGELVYEPDIRALPHPFPARLAAAGLGALVIAPLRSESRVFGVLVAARSAPQSFSSADCEFLGQLSAHVALAARQAELHGALQAAYDDLRRSQQGLLEQERLRALGQMASGIAHDINNAISPIVLYTESLLEREPGLSERGRAQLQTISCAIDDVAATVARLREFYRQRESPSDQRPLVLNDIARHVTELTRARWQAMPQQRGAVITPVIELAADIPTVRGAEAELREALINLVFNAVDAMPEGGSLTVRTYARAGHALPVVLEVADTGVGMDDATRQRCLEPFFTTKGERGTGLGLAMVYGTAQRHGAEIEIDSAPGHGTTVRLAFAAGGASSPAAPSPTAQPSRSLRVLLVDDDPVVLKSLGETLAQDGHSVEAASGGQAGIDAFAKAHAEGRPFDVVVTDLGMPYVDGRRVAAAVKSANPATPVVSNIFPNNKKVCRCHYP